MAEFVEDLQAMLDTASALISQDEVDQAWLILNRLENEYPDAADVPALMADAAMAVGDFEYALELYDHAIELDPEWSDAYSARAECLAEMGQLPEAVNDVDKALRLDSANPQAHWVRAVLAELGGKDRVAEDAYRTAAQIDPDGYHVPIRATRRTFDQAVKKAIGLLPPAFKARMTDVDVYVKDLPGPDERPESGLGPLIMGAYDGFTMTERQPSDPWSQMPPRICLYQKNIERVCRTRADLVREIEITLLHEVGHYFGLEDEDLQRIDLG
ncbi:MAG: metallopeptidase family protein [Deltaproteobacteria bacterium]|nr:metallopeptidase family protein [Deltaproteobacteria bacterium]